MWLEYSQQTFKPKVPFGIVFVTESPLTIYHNLGGIIWLRLRYQLPVLNSLLKRKVIDIREVIKETNSELISVLLFLGGFKSQIKGKWGG